MKKLMFLVLFAIISLSSFAQLDTIYSNNKKIPCSVKKVGQDDVTFLYPGEDAENSLDKNAIQKIVFKSGRVQKFAEGTSYKTVNGAEDFDNVTLTSVESEVKGLFKLGDVSSKAKGTTNLSSMEKVKERANRKMKIVAAMIGANIIYLTSNNTTEAHRGTYFEASQKTATNLSGVAYSNKLPSYDDFQRIYGNRTAYLASQRIELSGSDADYSTDKISKNVQIYKIYNESDLIMVNAKIDGVSNDLFRVSNFSNEGFTLVWKDGDDIYNWIILNPQPQEAQYQVPPQNQDNQPQVMQPQNQPIPQIQQPSHTSSNQMVLPKVYVPQTGDTVSIEEYSSKGADLNTKGYGIVTDKHDDTHWVVTYYVNGQKTTGFYQASEMTKAPNNVGLSNTTQGMVLPKVYAPQVGDTVSMEEYSLKGADLNIKGFGIITGKQDATHWIVTYVLNGQNTTGFYQAGEMTKVTK